VNTRVDPSLTKADYSLPERGGGKWEGWIERWFNLLFEMSVRERQGVALVGKTTERRTPKKVGREPVLSSDGRKGVENLSPLSKRWEKGGEIIPGGSPGGKKNGKSSLKRPNHQGVNEC